MNKRRLLIGAPLALLLLMLLALSASAQGGPTTIATGLNGPQGVLVAADGVWVTDTNSVVHVAPDGAMHTMATLPTVMGPEGPVGGSRLAVANGMVYVSNSEWDMAVHGDTIAPNTAAILKVSNGSLSEVANTGAFEKANNPNGDNVASHPYDLDVGPDGYLYVADAGANDLLRVNLNSGAVSAVAVFPPFPNNTGIGPPVSQAVPTGVVANADGTFYVGFLHGFPFPPGATKVVKVMADGTMSDYATGLTSLTDLQMGPDGNLYAVQFAVFNVDAPAPNSGALLRIKPGGVVEEVLSGLSFPTSVDFNAAGDAYLTINGVGAPGSGMVVRYDDTAPPPPPPAEIPEPATIALLGAGLAGLAGYARRRRQAA